MITLEQAKMYLRIDSNDEDIFLTSLVETSLIYIDSMVGDAYKTDTKAVKLADLLQLKIISDMYENRSAEGLTSNVKQDRITASILDKLANYTTE